MRAALLVALFSLSTTALALPFEGTWTGTGTFDASSWGGRFDANPAVVKIARSEDKIDTENCWSFVRNGTPTRLCQKIALVLSGTDLLFQGKVIGSYSDSTIIINTESDGVKTDATIELTNDGGMNWRFYSENAHGDYIHTRAENLRPEN